MAEMVLIAMTIVAIALITGMTLNGIVEKVMQGKRMRYKVLMGLVRVGVILLIIAVLAGLWQSGSGAIDRPAHRHLMFLPQKPYMVPGNLRAQLRYPLSE